MRGASARFVPEKMAELRLSEIAGMDCDDIEKLCLALGVAEIPQCLDVLV